MSSRASQVVDLFPHFLLLCVKPIVHLGAIHLTYRELPFHIALISRRRVISILNRATGKRNVFHLLALFLLTSAGIRVYVIRIFILELCCNFLHEWGCLAVVVSRARDTRVNLDAEYMGILLVMAHY